MMDLGFEDETNVLYIHSPYMNKLVERVIRDKIPRMIKTQSGNMKPLLDAKGQQILSRSVGYHSSRNLNSEK